MRVAGYDIQAFPHLHVYTFMFLIHGLHVFVLGYPKLLLSPNSGILAERVDSRVVASLFFSL